MLSLLCITIIPLTLVGSVFSQVTTPPALKVKVFADLGSNVTLPCRYQAPDTSFGTFGYRITWTKVADDEAHNEDVLLSMWPHVRTYGNFEDRVSLQAPDSEDASLLITDVSMDDMGRYRCEIVDGMEETLQEVLLEVGGGPADGVVFPYSPHQGRYNLNFSDAVEACAGQNAVVATYDQLLEAWKGGLDWCNAGWLSDGTVQYPITQPRAPCGGSNTSPGIRNYGRRNKQTSRYDVFCYASAHNGRFYWLVQPERLTYDEAVQACLDDGAEIAKVGHIYAAWKLEGYDRCDAGWLADGSIRYPISRPRKNCSPTEAAVRFVGFPDKKIKSYGVYCFKPDQ